MRLERKHVLPARVQGIAVRLRDGRAAAAAFVILAALLLAWGAGCAPALHASAVAPQAVQVRTSYFESGSHRIRADVYRPKAGGRRPAVIVIHGSSGVHTFPPNTASRYARALAEQGLVAVVVHYFDATHTVVANLADEEEHYGVWAGVLRDAVPWTARLPEVDANQVGILGHSLGAFLAVGVAASEPGISRIVLFGGGLEPFLPRNIEYMPPTLVFHGDADGEVPLEDARSLVDFLRARGCDVEFRLLPGEGHIFSESAVDHALTEAARFLAPALRGDAVK